MTINHVEDACTVLAQGDRQGAFRILEAGARAGDRDCFVELGTWFLSGQIVRRDLRRSRDCFRLAGEGGHTQAASIYRNFMAIGVGGDRDWAKALRDLRLASTNDPIAAAQLHLLEAMTIDENGEPIALSMPNVRSASPYVASYGQLLSTAECAYLVRLAGPMLQPSVVVDPQTGAMRPDPVRTSEAAMLAWANEDLVVHAINRRIAAASGTAVAAGEPLQILRYAPGQEYRPHFDALPNVANQRVLTVLVYLNNDYEGGETCFPKSDIRYRGKTGDALLFRNSLPDGRPDPAALHAGSAVTSGTKYLATRWIHQSTFVSLT